MTRPASWPSERVHPFIALQCPLGCGELPNPEFWLDAVYNRAMILLHHIIPILILVANCLAPLETPEFMRLTSTKESEFCEFATSINIWIA